MHQHQQSKTASKDHVIVLRSMNEVNRWKEQYDIIGSPYEWNLFISFHGRMIDDDGDIVELQEIASMQEPSHVVPTSEQYAAMSDIKRRLTQQTILIRHDASKFGGIASIHGIMNAR